MKRAAKPVTDTVRLNWLLALIREKGTNGINELQWDVRDAIYDDRRDVYFNRRVIDRSMRQQEASKLEKEGSR